MKTPSPHSLLRSTGWPFAGKPPQPGEETVSGVDPIVKAMLTVTDGKARAAVEARQPRLNSLDQFRGYTVAAMFAVNFLGGYAATPALLRHHNTWCSFADTVMPQFFFAAGMALRLVVQREIGQHGRAAALHRGIRRGLALMVLGFVWYGPRGFETWERLSTASGFDITRNVFLTSAFQALTHIGATSLWVLPVIAGSVRSRLLWMLGSAGLHAWLSYAIWYKSLFTWGVIDGGPLGFLTWTLPFLAGSLALDAVRGNAAAPLALQASPAMGGGEPQGAADSSLRSGGKPRSPLNVMFWAAAALMAMGYGLACFTQGGALAAPPFVPPWHPVDMWTMSQKAGSVSYLTFSAGFSLAVFAFFHWWSDLRGRSTTLFADLGRNALAAYLIHSVVMNTTEHLGPRTSPLWWAVCLSTVGFLLSWAFTRWLNERKIFLRL